MSSSVRKSSHPLRTIVAAAMMVLYLFISLSPLLSPALQSKTVLHALTGECSGDCDICGCSAESRASHTCCCARKAHLQPLSQPHDEIPNCCKRPPAPDQVVIASCGSPCGSGKAIASSGSRLGEIIPYYFNADLLVHSAEIDQVSLVHHLISRRPEPPDPPPRQA
jgi:hypothetical protein